MKAVFTFFVVLLSLEALAQYPAQAGRTGSTALHKDSTAIVAWAQGCILNRGFMNVANPSLGKTTVGDETMCTGKAGTNGVASLGDGGTATLTFATPIVNGAGPDFAVFENGFLYAFDSALAYLELAFVEVSSDGVHFVRFPSASLTDTTVQLDPYGTLDASKINNLAGKYVFPYGTPFDLEELKNEPLLDVNHITHVRLVDVTGSVNAMYAQRDASGRVINDPWPTDFPNGGFDLDAVAVINREQPNGIEVYGSSPITLFPNPCVQGSNVVLKASFDPNYLVNVNIISLATGELITAIPDLSPNGIVLPQLSSGIYLIEAEQSGLVYRSKLVVQ
ncbi:MAG: T9SS type A sorting domain-containing protein [Bacteroidia bacterium]|nr:T9SS type A sorting domain-containing protein [Bacteroidia bacterium]